MRSTLISIAAFAFAFALTAAGGAGAAVTQCRDAAGKFVQCQPAAAKSCRNALGARVKCGTTTSGAPARAYVGTPALATAKCKDGTYTSTKLHSGACAHHGGVAAWLK